MLWRSILVYIAYFEEMKAGLRDHLVVCVVSLSICV
jgi:hypothetical protein